MTAMPESRPITRSLRGCSKCKQRRLKCDERLPGCLRCEKFGQPCPGYTRVHKFFDQGASLRKKYAKKAAKPSVAPEDDTDGRPPAPSEEGSSLLEQSQVYVDEIDDSHTFETPSDPIGSRLLTSPVEPLRHPYSEHVIAESSRLDLFHNQQGDSLVTSIFDSLQPYPATTSEYPQASSLEPAQSTPSLDWSSQPAPTPKRPRLSEDSDHETAFLLRRFAKYLGPCLDIFDSQSFFSSYMPVKALESPLIRYAALAIAAKHHAKTIRQDFQDHLVNERFATTQVFPGLTAADWHYQAADYSDKAISYLQLYIRQAVPCDERELRYPPIGDSQDESTFPDFANDVDRLSRTLDKSRAPATKRFCGPLLDELLAASAILSSFDSRDPECAEWAGHLSGLKTLLDDILPAKGPLGPIRRAEFAMTTTQKAAFWLFVREDCSIAYITRRKTRIAPEDLVIWQAAGLPSSEENHTFDDSAPPDLVTKTLMWLLSRSVNFLISDDDDDATSPAESRHQHQGSTDSAPSTNLPPTPRRAETWLSLRAALQTWHAALPLPFQPCARLAPKARPTTTTAGPYAQALFPEVYHHVPLCAAAMAHYHFAAILLLLHHPPPAIEGSRQKHALGRLRHHRRLAEEVDGHVREIVGIGLARPPMPVRIQMVQALFVAGTCLDGRGEREVVVGLLEGVERECGWQAEYRVRDLRREWGWEEEGEGGGVGVGIE